MEIKQVTPSLVQFTRDKDRWYFDLPKGLEMDGNTGELYLSEKEEARCKKMDLDQDEVLQALIDQIEAYPSASWIASYAGEDKSGLYRWYAGHASYEEAQREMDDAGARGDRVHHAMKMLASGQTVRMSEYGHPEEWHYLQAGKNFIERYRPEIIDLEYSFRYQRGNLRVGGTIDIKCKIDIGRLLPLKKRAYSVEQMNSLVEETGEKVVCIADYKTGGVWTSGIAQVGKYASCDEDIRPPIDRAMIVQLGTGNTTWDKLNGPGFKVVEIDIAEAAGLFDYAYGFWQNANKNPRPRIESFPQELTVEL